MKKIIYIILGLFLAVGAIGTVVYNTQAGQDLIFKRVLGVVMNQQAPEVFDGLRAVVCGSASPLGNDPNRAQACIGVVTPQHFFLFDVGAGSVNRARQAGLPINRIDGVFITHFHSDHIANLPDINLASWIQGRKTPLKVYGPTGINQVVAGFNQAYALDQKYRNAHHGDHLLAPQAGPMQAHEFDTGIVWQDDLLTITAFTVEHPPIDPAVGYRIDYGGRSVVVSGDTNASANLFNAAENADVVFHDALSRTLLDPMIEASTEAQVPVMPQIMQDVIDYHADSHSIVEGAKQAGVKQLVYYHLVPVPLNGLAQDMFMRGLPKDIILAHDLQTFDLPKNSQEIIVHGP